MDLQTYLEQDMIAFLDRRLSVDYLKEQSAISTPKKGASSEYESQLFAAIKKKDVAGAKRVLHRVKESFEQQAPDSAERKQLEKTLHELYEHFKHFIETEQEFSQFEQDLDKFGGEKEGVKEQETDEPQASEPSKEDDLQAFEQELSGLGEASQPSKDEDPKEEETADTAGTPSKEDSQTSNVLEAILSRLSDAIGRADARHAHDLYEELKRRYSRLSLEQKRSYHDRLLKEYDKVLALIKHTSQKPKTKGAGARASSDASRKDLLAHEEAIVKSLETGAVHDAMRSYEALRDLILALPSRERKEHIKRAKKYYDRIIRAWKDAHKRAEGAGVLEAHERRLQGRP